MLTVQVYVSLLIYGRWDQQDLDACGGIVFGDDRPSVHPSIYRSFIALCVGSSTPPTTHLS
jgi:hypothetical protein